MVKWYKTYLEVYGNLLMRFLTIVSAKSKDNSKNVKTILHWYRLYSLHTMRNVI